jgi:sulfur-oxidizing protein SoxB
MRSSADPLPRARRQSGFRFMQGQLPHLVGQHLLKVSGVRPGTAEAHALTLPGFREGCAAYGKVGGFAHLATLVKRMRASRPGACCWMAATPGRARPRRCGPGPGHGRRLQAAGCGRDDRALGVHPGHGAGEGDRREGLAGKVEFVAQNVKTNDFGDPVFQALRAARDQRRLVRDHRPGLPLHPDRQSALHGG